MTDSFEFTLNNPLTYEQWDMITDVDFNRTDRITFHTKHGKEVEFIKVIRCKDCKFHCDRTRRKKRIGAWFDDDYCNGAVMAEREEDDTDRMDNQH